MKVKMSGVVESVRKNWCLNMIWEEVVMDEDEDQ